MSDSTRPRHRNRTALGDQGWAMRNRKLLGRLNGVIFVSAVASWVIGAGLGKLAEWGWLQTSDRYLDYLNTLAAALLVISVVVFFVLPEGPKPEENPTSERLSAVMERFNGLDTLIVGLADEVREMAKSSVELEARAREAEALMNLSKEEKGALLKELDRRDRAGSRRDVVLFAAGLAAGVLTNLVIK